jgi:hypothetical protein
VSAERTDASAARVPLPPTLAAEVLEQSLLVVPTLDLRDIGARLIAPIAAATRSTRASLMVVNPVNGNLRIVAGHGIPAERIGRDAPWRPNSIAEWVFRKKQGLVLQGQVQTESLQGSGEHAQDSTLCLPLEGHGGMLGVLNLARRAPQPPFDDAEREELEAVLAPLAVAIERALHAQSGAHFVRQLAATAPVSLLAPGRTGLRHHEVGFGRVTSAHVAGDHAERVGHANGAQSLLVMDPSGDGVDAAVAAAFVQGGFVAAGGAERSPAARVGQLGAELFARGQGRRFVALWCGHFAASGVLTSCTAGHAAPLWVPHDDSPVTRLVAGGPPAGAVAAADWEEEQVRLFPGDLVVVASDGVLQARNVMGEPFGEDRVLECVSEHKRDTLDRMVEAVLGAVVAWSGRPVPVDDLQVVIVRFRPDR